ncbi:TetR/AcrR family transcriptional regulator [Lactobacillaceae bacterium L1_55_11]|nr:TetR/AcrR family transcriptional regulator [Lactobacillaceae bacterium L1_55_11]
MATKVAHEKTRQRILDAATDLFLQNGYEQTTTREIAKQLGISQPALYHHFGDKETLFVEVIRAVGGQIQKEMEEILATDYDSGLDQLTDMTLAILTRHPRDVFTLIHGSFPALSAASQRILGMTFGVDYVAPVQKFFESDAVELQDDVDAHVASSFYITSLAPLFSNFHALDANQDLRDRIQQLLNLILYGVAQK